ncbi:MAG: bifunctional pyr operon transcriptional regulator/uracil phosphoribosyltransferase PyrR [Ignavibacteria bacterium]|nr:bifunctional pyr operon transcriptional regulator/uracil phosphoribosyltransferase PyrR [Ignavibacteria bacterium]
MKTKILDSTSFTRTLSRLAHEIIEKNRGAENLAIVGIRTRGEYLSRRLAKTIFAIEQIPLLTGALDITLYRDDLSQLDKPVMKGTDIPFDIANKKIILVDDVLFTGRTVRAALNELMDLGRPANIQLAVLIDRGHRELPIEPNYVGTKITTEKTDDVQVTMKEIDGEDGAVLIMN